MGRPGSKQSMGRDSAEAVLVYTHSVAPAMPPALELRGHHRVARSHGFRPGGSLLRDPPTQPFVDQSGRSPIRVMKIPQ